MNDTMHQSHQFPSTLHSMLPECIQSTTRVLMTTKRKILRMRAALTKQMTKAVDMSHLLHRMMWEEIEEEVAEASRTYYTNCPGGHGLKIHRTKDPGWTCSECRKSYPKNTNLMRCNQCDYDLCRNCFGPREDSMSKF